MPEPLYPYHQLREVQAVSKTPNSVVVESDGERFNFPMQLELIRPDGRLVVYWRGPAVVTGAEVFRAGYRIFPESPDKVKRIQDVIDYFNP